MMFKIFNKASSATPEPTAVPGREAGGAAGDKSDDSPSWFTSLTDKFKKNDEQIKAADTNKVNHETNIKSSNNVSEANEEDGASSLKWFQNLKDKISGDKNESSDPHQELYDIDKAQENNTSWFSSFKDRFQKDQDKDEAVSLPSVPEPSPTAPSKNVTLFGFLKNKFGDGSDSERDEDDKAHDNVISSSKRESISGNSSLNWFENIKGRFRKDSVTTVDDSEVGKTFTNDAEKMQKTCIDKKRDQSDIDMSRVNENHMQTYGKMQSVELRRSSGGTCKASDMNKRTAEHGQIVNELSGVLQHNNSDNTAASSPGRPDTNNQRIPSYIPQHQLNDGNENNILYDSPSTDGKSTDSDSSHYTVSLSSKGNNNTDYVCDPEHPSSDIVEQNISNSQRSNATLKTDRNQNWKNIFKQESPTTAYDENKSNGDNNNDSNTSSVPLTTDSSQPQHEKQSEISWFANIKQHLQTGNEKKRENNDSSTFFSSFKKIFDKDEKQNDTKSKLSPETAGIVNNNHERNKENESLKTSSDKSAKSSGLITDNAEPQNEVQEMNTNDRHKTNNKSNNSNQGRAKSVQKSQNDSNDGATNKRRKDSYNPFDSGSDSVFNDPDSESAKPDPTLLQLSREESNKRRSKNMRLPVQASVESSTANTVTDSDDNQDMQALFKRVSKTKSKSKQPQRPNGSDDEEEIDDMEIFNDVSIRKIRESLNREHSVDSSVRTGSIKSTGGTESDISKSAHDDKSLSKTIKKKWKKIVKKQRSVTKKHNRKRITRDSSIGTCSYVSDSENNATGASFDIDSGTESNAWASEYKYQSDQNKPEKATHSDIDGDMTVHEKRMKHGKKDTKESKPAMTLKDLCKATPPDSQSDHVLSSDDVSENQRLALKRHIMGGNNAYHNPSFRNSSDYEHSEPIKSNNPTRKHSSFDTISLESVAPEKNAKNKSNKNIENSEAADINKSETETGWFQNLKQKLNIDNDSSQKDKESPSKSTEQIHENKTKETGFFDSIKERFTQDSKSPEAEEVKGSDDKEMKKERSESPSWFDNLKQKMNIGNENRPEENASENNKQNSNHAISQTNVSSEDMHKENNEKETGFFDSIKGRFGNDATSNTLKPTVDPKDNPENTKTERSESPSWFDNLKQKMNIGNDDKIEEKHSPNVKTTNDAAGENDDSNWFDNFKQKIFNDDDKTKENDKGNDLTQNETHVIKITRRDSSSDHDSDDSVFIRSTSGSVTQESKISRKSSPVENAKSPNEAISQKSKPKKYDEKEKQNKETTQLNKTLTQNEMHNNRRQSRERTNPNLDRSNSEYESEHSDSSQGNNISRHPVPGLTKNKTRHRNSTRKSSANEDKSGSGSSEPEDLQRRSNGSSERRRRQGYSQNRNKHTAIDKRVSPLGQPERSSMGRMTSQRENIRIKRPQVPPPVIISVKEKNRPTNFDPLSYKGGTGRKLPSIPRKPSNLAYTPPDPPVSSKVSSRDRSHQHHQRSHRNGKSSRMYTNQNRLSVEDAERGSRGNVSSGSNRNRWDEVDNNNSRFNNLAKQHSSESEWTAMGHDRPSVSGSSTACMPVDYGGNHNQTDPFVSSRRGDTRNNHTSNHHKSNGRISSSSYVSPSHSDRSIDQHHYQVNTSVKPQEPIPYSQRRPRPKRVASRDEWEDYRRGINIPFHWGCCSACQSD